MPHVDLRRAGTNLIGRCPFHEETTASFAVNPHKNIWKCFGCGAGGSVIDLVMAVYGVQPREAARILVRDFGVWVPGKLPHPRTKKEREAFEKARQQAAIQAEERELEAAFKAWCDRAHRCFALLYRCGSAALEQFTDPGALASVARLVNMAERCLDTLAYGSDDNKLQLFLDEEVRSWVTAL